MSTTHKSQVNNRPKGFMVSAAAEATWLESLYRERRQYRTALKDPKDLQMRSRFGRAKQGVKELASTSRLKSSMNLQTSPGWDNGR